MELTSVLRIGEVIVKGRWSRLPAFRKLLFLTLHGIQAFGETPIANCEAEMRRKRTLRNIHNVKHGSNMQRNSRNPCDC